MHNQCLRVIHSLLKLRSLPYDGCSKLGTICLKLKEYNLLVSLFKHKSFQILSPGIASLVLESWKTYGSKFLREVPKLQMQEDVLTSILQYTKGSMDADKIKSKEIALEMLLQHLQQNNIGTEFGYFSSGSQADKWVRLADSINDEKLTNLVVQQLTCQDEQAILRKTKPLLERLANQGFKSSPVFKALRNHCINIYQAIINKHIIPATVSNSWFHFSLLI